MVKKKFFAALASFVLFTLALAHAAHAQPASAPSGEAKTHLDRGVSLYQSGAYDEAAAEFQAGLRILDHADLWYALAQAERKLGHCAKAIDAYRHFLKSHPPAEEAERAELNVKRCEEELAAQKPLSAPTASAIPAVVAPPPSSSMTPSGQPPPSPDTGYTGLQVIGVGVVATGGLLIGVGTYFALRAQSDWNVVNDAAQRHDAWSGDLQRRYESADSAETKATLLFVAGGAAAAVGGVLFYLGVRDRAAARARSSPRASFVPVRAAASVAPGGRGGKVVVGCGF
jgi:tetratricopeptide (TPR) repeat protein